MKSTVMALSLAAAFAARPCTAFSDDPADDVIVIRNRQESEPTALAPLTDMPVAAAAAAKYLRPGTSPRRMARAARKGAQT